MQTREARLNLSNPYLTFDGDRLREHFVAEDGVKILELAVSGHGHTAGEEGHVPQVCEAHGKPTVGAEDTHRRERTGNSDPERDHVGQRGDGDRYGRLGHHVTHALRHRQLHRGASPGSEHDERVVDTDSWKRGRVREEGCMISM